MRTNSVSLLKKVLESYNYVGLLAKLDVVDEVRDGQLAFIDIAGTIMYESLEIITRHDISSETRLKPIVENLDRYLGSICERK